MNATRFQTTTALFASAAALAMCGATLMDRPLSAGSVPSGVGPVGPAAATSPFVRAPRASDIVRGAEAPVGSIAHDPIGTTDRMVDESLSTVRTVRDDTLHTAGRTVTATVATATRTVASALDSVGQVRATARRTVDAVGTTATSTVSQVETIALDRVATTLSVARTVVGQATTLAVSLTKISATADIDALAATGTITVSDGDAVMAKADLQHGKAIVTITAPVLGTTQLTITYGGSTLLAPSSTVL